MSTLSGPAGESVEPGGCTAFCSHSNSNTLIHPARDSRRARALGAGGPRPPPAGRWAGCHGRWAAGALPGGAARGGVAGRRLGGQGTAGRLRSFVGGPRLDIRPVNPIDWLESPLIGLHFVDARPCNIARRILASVVHPQIGCRCRGVSWWLLRSACRGATHSAARRLVRPDYI